MIIKRSEELAYWIGIVQSDGYFEKYTDKTGRKYVNIRMQVSKKSLSMLIKFQKLSKKIFSRSPSIFKLKKRDQIFICHIGVKTLLEVFKNLDIRFEDPPKPPFWVIKNFNFFGAYLAGLIDGDGDVRIKRKKYPQCAIRIWSGHEQVELSRIIRNFFNCYVGLILQEKISLLDGRKIYGRGYAIEFYVSSKNYDFVEKFIIPNLALEYKRKKILSFLKQRINAPTGI